MYSSTELQKLRVEVVELLADASHTQRLVGGMRVPEAVDVVDCAIQKASAAALAARLDGMMSTDGAQVPPCALRARSAGTF